MIRTSVATGAAGPLARRPRSRTYRRLSDALHENINARVWAGIHFRTADLAGARLGRKVARYPHRHDLQPVR